MLITTFCLNRTLTTLISETIFPGRVFTVIDHPDFRAAVWAEWELVTTKSQRVYSVVAIRALVCGLHSFFFDKAHDTGIRLDKVCQILKKVAFADYSLKRLKAHRIPVDFVQTPSDRVGLAEISQFRSDFKTPQ